VKHDALFQNRLDDDVINCGLCSHRCTLAPGEYGFCNVRFNDSGKLKTLAYGELISAAVDPIEKKPLYHFMPGSAAFSIATPGCNFRCGFCQNWNISQIGIRDEHSKFGEPFTPEEVVQSAVDHGSQSIAYTYTEPTVFYEYAYDIAVIAARRGLKNIFVTNGYMTGQMIDHAEPVLHAANVDLKSFRDEFYLRQCKARLQPVLNSIRRMKALGIWVEITTLLIPGENDSDDELREIASFIAETGVEIPWHISRFFPQYHMRDKVPTAMDVIERACKIGREAGLRYVYPGNVPEESDTRCHVCNALLIRRFGFGVAENRLTPDGACPRCRTVLDGVLLCAVH
jgi:pyruvate formate lyase activating enzyme